MTPTLGMDRGVLLTFGEKTDLHGDPRSPSAGRPNSDTPSEPIAVWTISRQFLRALSAAASAKSQISPRSAKRWQKKSPAFSKSGKNRAYYWRRPTLTGPIVPLPSALESFTSGFGMGPGGSSLLWPPEVEVRRPLRASTSIGLSKPQDWVGQKPKVFPRFRSQGPKSEQVD